MSFGYVLAWFVGTWCLITALRLLKAKSRRAGWIAVHVGILFVLAAISWWESIELGGYIAAALWVLFSLLPSAGSVKVQQLSFRNDFAGAERLARLVALVHPFDGWRRVPRLFRGLALEQAGQHEEAEQWLGELERATGPMARMALLTRYRIRGQWEQVLARLRLQGSESDLLREPGTFLTYLRALGETGSVPELVTAAQRLDESLEPAAAQIRDLARLFAFAFAGQRAAVERLVLGPLVGFPDTMKVFWLGTAAMAAGQDAEGRFMLEPLLRGDDRLLRTGVERRLERGLPVAEPLLDPEARLALHRMEETAPVESVTHPAMPGAPSIKQAYATQLILASCVLAFLGEIYLGGSTDIETLYSMGALLVTREIPFEPWRLFAANFLHFGPVHLAMNGLGLIVLGPFVEQSLGRWRFLLVYLLSGVLSMGSVFVASGMLLGKTQVLVGASGGIMGLVGATAAVLLVGWWRDGNTAAKRRLPSIGWILGFQALFDLMTPAVSMTAHLSGAFFGFFLGCLAFLSKGRPR